MFRTLNRTLKTFLNAAPIVALALIAVAAASPAVAQTHCTTWADTLLNTSSNCVSEPWRPRSSDVQTFRWDGHDYMVLHTGNEMSIFNIDDPANPSLTTASDFDFGTRGDSDYDLVDFDFCDDCRYAISSHKVARTVIFDLGTGSTPVFQVGPSAWTLYDAIDRKIGGFVFKKGGQQYVVTASGTADCSGSALYTLGGTSSLGFIQCIEIGGAATIIKGLEAYDTGAAFYLFTGDLNGAAQVFRVDGAGASVSLALVATPVGMRGQQFQFSIDHNNDLLASVNSTEAEIQIWDIEDPEAPVRLWTVPGDATNVSLQSASPGAVPTMIVNRPGWPSSTRTFTVESSGPDEFEASFWTDGSLDHNDLPVCAFASGGALSFDGSVVFLSRYAIHQVFDLEDCLTPTPAVANLVVTPSEAFPGDTVNVRDISTGRVDRWAVWVTEGPSPAGTPLPPGTSSTPSTLNSHEVNFVIPQDLPVDDEYWAHVEVEADELVPADPDYDVEININRAPQASITVTPEAVVVGESVTLTATAEGNPDSTPYTWTIDPPLSANFNRTGASTTVTLDEAGVWAFYLTVDYQHGTSIGTYQASAEITGFTVTSVAADFTISPPSPLHTQDILLNGSSSKPVGGDLSFQWTVEESGGSDTYDGCPALEICTIPGESLNPNTIYNVTLGVTNNDDDETDLRVKSMVVGDGSIAPVINFTPASPDIGDPMVFTITGVPGDIDLATWNMGGSGCDGESAIQECEPYGLYVDCKTMPFKYASSGTKSVHLELDIGGNIFEADTSVTVESSGSCDGGGGGPEPCEYTLGTNSFELRANPSTKTRTVAIYTTSGCTWYPVTGASWIEIVSPEVAQSGTGAFTFRVTENTGPYRTGSIIVGGEVLVVSQEAPFVEATFEMSNRFPLKGEVVTFSVDPILEVQSWDFGEANCKNPEGSGFINCAVLPSGACNTYQWTFPTAGEKDVTMVVTDGRSKTRHPTVQNSGECCLADGRPDASFDSSAEEIFAGDMVYFTDTSSKSSLNTKALSLTWLPAEPEIGDDVTFTLSGVAGSIDRATWDFGEEGCEKPSVGVCEPHPIYGGSCTSITFAYASGGSKSVSVDLELAGGGTDSIGPVTVDVANSGSCDGGGGGGCSYSLSPTAETFGFEGGSGSFAVNTTSECPWDATTTASWLTINSGQGTGSGTVAFTVDAHTGFSTRSGIIRVEGKNFRVTQTADLGDTAPTAWVWTVTRVEDENGDPMDLDVATSTEQNYSYAFNAPGRYRVSMTATNCAGSNSTYEYIRVNDAPVENFVIGAAISQPGANNTQWETDLRFYNPCEDSLAVSLVYQPDNQDNSAKQLSEYPFTLAPNETVVYPSAREVVNIGEEESVNGSILIDSTSESGCKVLSVSRTFNDTPDGTLGLFVPTMPVTSVGVKTLNLTGLISNDDYRSNLRLINHGDAEAKVKITVYHKSGTALSEGKVTRVRSHSTKQINDVAGWAGVEGNLSQFTVLAEVKTEGAIVDGFGTVIDNISGDSVLNASTNQDEPIIWQPGVAHTTGRNDTFWQTDVWFHNPKFDDPWLTSKATYVDGGDVDINYLFEAPEWPAVEAMGMRKRLDIAGSILDDLGVETTSGYLIFEGLNEDSAPQIAARTFTSDDSGGTYGLRLPSYGSRDLFQVGEIVYIVGVSNSADSSTGFRTNMGMLATGKTADVRVTFFYPDGTEAPEPWTTKVWKGQLKQVNNIFSKFGLGNQTVTGTFKIEILSGGDLIIYATEIDNQIGDSIFIPAQEKYVNPVQ